MFRLIDPWLRDGTVMLAIVKTINRITRGIERNITRRSLTCRDTEVREHRAEDFLHQNRRCRKRCDRSTHTVFLSTIANPHIRHVSAAGRKRGLAIANPTSVSQVDCALTTALNEHVGPALHRIALRLYE